MRSSIGWSKALRWVRNGRAAAPPLVSCRIGVSTSTYPRSSRVLRSDFSTAALVRTISRASGSHDHVDVAQPDPGLVGERLVLVGQRAQRLGDHRPRRRLHRQLAAAAGDHLAGDADEVADVDQRLEVGQRLLADLGQRQHRLQLGAVALAQPDEAELAGVAEVDDPAGDRDLSPVRVSGSSSCGVVRSSRISASVWVRSHRRPGTPRAPDSSSRCRFSRRTRICSGRSSSAGGLGGVGQLGRAVMAPAMAEPSPAQRCGRRRSPGPAA